MKSPYWYRKQSIRRKIFIPFFAITLLTTTVFTIYGFIQNNRAIVNDIDRRLLIAALTMEQLLPEDYFDRAIEPDAIDDVEHDRNSQVLNVFLENVGATYLYALTKEDGRYYFVASAEVGWPYWEEYVNPAPNIFELERTGRVHVSTTDDPDYGLLRSVVRPVKNADGRRFIIGADINAHEVTALKQRALINFLVMGVASFLGAVLFSYLASVSITRPLMRLSRFTRNLVEGDFSAAIRLDPALFPDRSETNDETALLSFDFDLMQQNLEQHIEELKITQSARERAESELRIAGRIQETFLPGPFDTDPFGGRIQLHAAMLTAKQASGDLYDYFAIDDTHVFFTLGDVSGKGMPAALFMSAVVVLLRSTARLLNDPAEILVRINDAMAERNESCTFVTIFVGVLNTRTGEIRFCNGGHNPPRLLGADGAVNPWPVKTNTVVGPMEGFKYVSETRTLQPGEGLFLYTDGVTEALNEAGALYGEERMDTILSRAGAGAMAEQVNRGILDDVAAFSGQCEQADDITLLTVRYVGSSGLD